METLSVAINIAAYFGAGVVIGHLLATSTDWVAAHLRV